MGKKHPQVARKGREEEHRKRGVNTGNVISWGEGGRGLAVHGRGSGWLACLLRVLRDSLVS